MLYKTLFSQNFYNGKGHPIKSDPFPNKKGPPEPAKMQRSRKAIKSTFNNRVLSCFLLLHSDEDELQAE